MKSETFPKWVINLFFIVGILSAVGFRSIVILNHYGPDLVRLVWYFSVIGYIFFFCYRYVVSTKRVNIILKNNLITKIVRCRDLTLEDSTHVRFILHSILVSKERFNYLLMSSLSIVAIIADVILCVRR